DLVPDVRDAAVRPRREAGHHPPVPVGCLHGSVRGDVLGRERQGPAGMELTQSAARSYTSTYLAYSDAIAATASPRVVMSSKNLRSAPHQIERPIANPA